MAKIILSRFQKDALAFIAEDQFGKNFYWTGGTLLSYYYLHHRNSVDLDFFSDDLYPDDSYLIFINGMKKKLGIDQITMSQENNRRQYLLIRGKESLKLEMVFFPFPNVKKRVNIKEFKLTADSLTDIMINKILASYQRKEVKDAYDLYVYLNSRLKKHSLFDLVYMVEKKFGVAIEPALLLAKLNELSDNLKSIQPLIFRPPENLTQKMHEFFQMEFNKFARKYIK